MIAVLIAVRDFLLALAFAWVGVTLDRPSNASAPQAQPQQHAQTAQSGGASSTASCSAARLCATGERPHFDALNCDEK